MKILTNWLREFVDIPVDDRQLAHDLTMAGMAVDALETAANGEPLLDVDITTNRPDAMNHYGLARECAAIYDRDLKWYRPVVKESPRAASEVAAVETAAPDLCPRYCARVILGVKIGPSPDWMVRRLAAAGLRSINNVADVTNYLMLEIGQPLHAFDLDTLRGRRIVVRRAVEGEAFQTLDGVQRTCTSEQLMIADAERAVAIAGVMGGEETGISERTVNVLLESAWFEPKSIRRTARAHGMHTDASHRFERGADIDMAPVAADRAALLIQQVAGGEIPCGLLDAYPARRARTGIELRRRELDRILGVQVPAADVLRILRRLGFQAEDLDYGYWKMVPPAARLDVEREIDVIEEVARHYGLDKFPNRLPALTAGARRQPTWAAEREIREVCRALGYHETISFTITAAERNRRFSAIEPVTLTNPLSAEWAVLRGSLLTSLADAVEWNLNRGIDDVRLFELGRTYRLQGEGYDEPPVLGLAATALGSRNFAHLKGHVEAILERFAVQDVVFTAEPGAAHFHPGRAARATSHGEPLAVFGEIHPDLSAAIGLRIPVLAAEIHLRPLFAAGLHVPRFQPVSKYPAVARDLSLLLPGDVVFAGIAEAVAELGVPDLRRVEAGDVFRGGQVPAGRYSLLLKLLFQSGERTLSDEEVNELTATIVAMIEKRFQGQLRK